MLASRIICACLDCRIIPRATRTGPRGARLSHTLLDNPTRLSRRLVVQVRALRQQPPLLLAIPCTKHATAKRIERRKPRMRCRVSRAPHRIYVGRRSSVRHWRLEQALPSAKMDTRRTSGTRRLWRCCWTSHRICHSMVNGTVTCICLDGVHRRR